MAYDVVPHIKNGVTTFSEADLNPIITALENRTDDLKSKIQSIGGNQGYLLSDTGFSASCAEGMLVCRNPVNGLYEPAAAEWDTARFRADGSQMPSYKAFVIGVLVTPVQSNGAATIMCHGWTDDEGLVNILAPSRTGVGDYYLGSNGKAVLRANAPSDMSVYCYTYTSTGKIIFRPQMPEYGGHSHVFCKVTGSWYPVTDFSDVAWSTVAPTATYAIRVTSNQPIVDIIKSGISGQCLTHNGLEVYPDTWGTAIGTGSTGNYYIWIATTPVTGDTFVYHAMNPFLVRDSIVKSVTVKSDCKLLTAEATGGKVYLSTNFTPDETNVKTGNCVVVLGNGSYKTGPVVQGLHAGLGMQISQYTDGSEVVNGVYVLSVDELSHRMIDMEMCNLNGVVIGSSQNNITYVFPSGIQSSLVGTMRVPHHSMSNQKAKLVLVFKGNGSSITGLAADVTIQQLPTTSGGIEEGLPVQYTVGNVQASSTSMYYKKEIQIDGTMSSDALVTVKLKTTAAPQTSITLLSMSLQMVVGNE